MHISLPESLTELKEFLKHLDQFLQDKAMEYMRQCYKVILEDVDEGHALFGKAFRTGGTHIIRTHDIDHTSPSKALQDQYRTQGIRNNG